LLSETFVEKNPDFGQFSSMYRHHPKQKNIRNGPFFFEDASTSEKKKGLFVIGCKVARVRTATLRKRSATARPKLVLLPA